MKVEDYMKILGIIIIVFMEYYVWLFSDFGEIQKFILMSFFGLTAFILIYRFINFKKGGNLDHDNS